MRRVSICTYSLSKKAGRLKKAEIKKPHKPEIKIFLKCIIKEDRLCFLEKIKYKIQTKKKGINITAVMLCDVNRAARLRANHNFEYFLFSTTSFTDQNIKGKNAIPHGPPIAP